MAKAMTSDTVVVKKQGFLQRVAHDWQLVLLALPGFVFYIIFRYGPLYGLQIAFKDYGIFTGIMASPWSEPLTKHFQDFFSSGDFWVLLGNTLKLGVFNLLWSFPFPVIFALFFNELKSVKFKKLVQTSTFLPSLISTVVLASMVIDMLSPSSGIINKVIVALGGKSIYFMIKPEWFRTVYIASDIWQHFGYNAIIYIAALSNVDQQLYEAAKIDGCSRIKSLWYVTLPGILPTVATMFILNAGSVIKVGADKVLLLYNPATYEVADIFSTYVYRKGILETNYSYSTAVGLFESLAGLVMVLLSNYVSRKLTETSLW